MWNFLVLGIIPGTDIQINFKLWLLVFTASVLAFVLLRSTLRKLRANTKQLPPTLSPEAN